MPAAVEDLQAVVLAGGLGLRLRPAVADLPKVMAPVAGQPFLAHLLGRLQRQGVRRVVLCVGHKAEDIAGHFGDGRRHGLQITYSVEDTPAGTGGALRLACRLLDPAFLLLNGDTAIDLDLCELRDYHRARGGLVTVVGRRWRGRPRQDAGYVLAARGGRALAFTRGPVAGRVFPEGELWVNCGWFMCERRAAEMIRRPPGAMSSQDALSLESGLFASVLGAIFVFPTTQPFVDIGTPERYRRLKREWEDNAVPEPGPPAG
ncbi:MAG: sugar phosphate nucleotidyltransferase [Bacillota bacterium]|nr:sugar phosphate nucleotidyltransferase [Bacillota bacterium]